MSVIVGVATPMGRSAIGVVRMSGKEVLQCASFFVRGPKEWTPNRQRRVELFDEKGVFDDGLTWYGKAPHTYTGEDTLEINCHGNPIILQRLLDAACAAGARLAEAGEFTRRALVNGKIDLIGAEAVLLMAEATSSEGLDIARSGLDGRFIAFFHEIRSVLITYAADLEARLDYPEDELAFFTDESILAGLTKAQRDVQKVLDTFEPSQIAIAGARIALVGPVNAGKSSLFNALLGRSRALVHNTPGTTRDVLEVVTRFGDLQVTLMDTAGERETEDPIEAAGLALAKELIEDADLLLVVCRSRSEGLNPTEKELLERTALRKRICIRNGVDEFRPEDVKESFLLTSTKTGEGIEELKRAIEETLIGNPLTRSGFLRIATTRQRDALVRVLESLKEASEALIPAGPAVATDALTRAIEAIDELFGYDTRENVLDVLFSRFCIGK